MKMIRSSARTAVTQALQAVAEARTHQQPARTHCEAGQLALDGYEGHVRAIKFDRPDRDVSEHGRALRGQSQQADGESRQSQEQGEELGKLNDVIEERILTAISNTPGSNRTARAALDDASRDQQMMETHSLPSLRRGLAGATRALGSDLPPYLTEVEADAPGRDVGRFASDLQDLLGEGSSDLRQAQLASGWILQDLDDLEASLNKALQAL